MGKKFLLILLILALLPGGIATAEESGKLVVATVNPVYTSAINIARDVPGIEIRQLLPLAAGCGHDYQLTPEDVRNIEGAELLLSHGIELESYLTNLRDAYPDLPMLDTAKNVELIETGEEAHAHEEEGHSHGLYNPHTWMDPQAAITQAQEICRYFISIDELNSALYNANCDAYVEKLQALDAEIAELLAPLENRKVIAYHGTFAYFARRYDFTIEAEIAASEDAQPSSQKIAQIIDLVREENIPMLWLESEAEASALLAVTQETDIQALVLDAGASGEVDDYDAYINAQRANAQRIAEAMQ